MTENPLRRLKSLAKSPEVKSAVEGLSELKPSNPSKIMLTARKASNPLARPEGTKSIRH